MDRAIGMFRRVQDMGLSPDTMLYNAILLGLCKNCTTDLAIDFLAYMVSNSNGGMPDESTYIILIEGLSYEGFSDEAKELLESL